jgi:hypothetical protein
MVRVRVRVRIRHTGRIRVGGRVIGRGLKQEYLLAQGDDLMNRTKTKQDKTRQDTTRHDTTRHDTTRHDTTRQDKTRQDKTRHEKISEDRSRAKPRPREDKKTRQRGKIKCVLFFFF